MLDLQKAGIFKRFSAFLCDTVLLFVLALGAALLCYIITDYSAYAETVNESKAYYEEKYGEDIIYAADPNALGDEQRAQYDAAVAETNADSKLNYAYQMISNLAILIPAISFLFAYLCLEFVVPLCLKNGQTVGKKIFGIGVMKANGVKISPAVLFVRTILGKYTMETMVPVFILILVFLGTLGGAIGIIVIAAIVVLNIVVMCVTKTNSTIHDLLAYTVTVDMGSQRIFENEQELIEYKKKLHAEAAENADY